MRSLIQTSHVTGDTADEDFMKIAKKFAKKEEEAKKEPEVRRKAPRGRGFGSRGNYHGGFSGYSPAFNPWMMSPMAAMGWTPPAPTAMTPPSHVQVQQPRSYKANLRCNNCGDLGHFAKECPKSAMVPK